MTIVQILFLYVQLTVRPNAAVSIALTTESLRLVDDQLDMRSQATTARTTTRGNNAEIDFLNYKSSQNGIDNTLGVKDLASKEIYYQNETYAEELFDMAYVVARNDGVGHTPQDPKTTEEGGALLKMISLFINQNICCGCSKEPSQ